MDRMTPSTVLCENCQSRPARVAWKLSNGTEVFACGQCGRPADGTSMRDLDSNELAALVRREPLTVKEAAKHENVDTKTIYRMLPALEASAGAWKVGSTWRIDPDALREARQRSRQPQRRTRAEVAPKPSRTKAAATPTDELGWPSK